MIEQILRIWSILSRMRFNRARNFCFFFPFALKSSFKSHQMTIFLVQKRGLSENIIIWVKTSSFEWKHYYFKQTKLSFDDFLMTTLERENEWKKEPQIPRVKYCFELKYVNFFMSETRFESKWVEKTSKFCVRLRILFYFKLKKMQKIFLKNSKGYFFG